jgi:hypothetical protein
MHADGFGSVQIQGPIIDEAAIARITLSDIEAERVNPFFGFAQSNEARADEHIKDFS